MTTKVEQAVILAAGIGKRINNVIHDMPKGFIRFGKKPIIEESIENLLRFHIGKIFIVTGFCSQFYEELSKKYSCIETVKNEKYMNSGSMYSLYCVRDMIEDNFLVLESDLIYEPRALEELLNFPKSDVILISDFTYAGDEVFVETASNTLVNMSKTKALLENVAGEFVGISKISIELYKEMIRLVERKFEHSLKLDYETDGFVYTAKRNSIFCHKVEDLLWCEIDDYSHFINAKENIYPKIHSSWR